MQKKVPNSTVIPPKQEIQINIELDGDTSLSGIYICLTCKNTLLGGKMPAMAVQNGLHLPHVPEDYQLTELENNLIAQMLNFQYIYRLPKSRWGATKKRMISVPVTRETVSETLSQLPRLPKDAGLIPLVPANLKRKMEYKNAHKTEYIDPEKVLKVVKYLKDSNHPFYQFCDDLNLDTYKERCKEQDQRGFELLFSEDQNNEKSRKIPPNNENGGMPKIDTESDLDEEPEEICEEDNTHSKIGEEEIERMCKAYQELVERFDGNWNDIDEEKILKTLEHLSHHPNFHFLKDFNIDTFKKRYKTLTIDKTDDEDSDIEKQEENDDDNNKSLTEDENQDANEHRYEDVLVIHIENQEENDKECDLEKQEESDDEENWTDVDSEDESQDENEGGYEDITIICNFIEEKIIVNIYRENSDSYIATLSENKLERIQATVEDNDVDKVVENTYIILNKLYFEAMASIEEVKKPKNKPTYIHMDREKGELLVRIYMKLP